MSQISFSFWLRKRVMRVLNYNLLRKPETQKVIIKPDLVARVLGFTEHTQFTWNHSGIQKCVTKKKSNAIIFTQNGICNIKFGSRPRGFSIYYINVFFFGWALSARRLDTNKQWKQQKEKHSVQYKFSGGLLGIKHNGVLVWFFFFMLRRRAQNPPILADVV